MSDRELMQSDYNLFFVIGIVTSQARLLCLIYGIIGRTQKVFTMSRATLFAVFAGNHHRSTFCGVMPGTPLPIPGPRSRYSPDRVPILKNETNVGKRIGILNAVRRTSDEFIVSVDSDVVLDPDAIGLLTRGFNKPSIGAVGGRIRVRNACQNWLTRLQTIKYYFAYEYFKNIELAYHSILCLSGCLTAYRRSILAELEPVLEDRNILGVPIKYGEDRFLTRQVIKAGHETFMTHEAICWTLVPNSFSKYWSQQLRWRRSVLIDFLCGLSHSWKLPPLVMLNYAAIFAMLVGYPLLIAQSLANGMFMPLASFHLMVLALLGAIYWVGTRKWPKNERVHPLWFLPMAFVLPTIYLILTPLAILTLDSSSWETRK